MGTEVPGMARSDGDSPAAFREELARLNRKIDFMMVKFQRVEQRQGLMGVERITKTFLDLFHEQESGILSPGLIEVQRG